MDELSELKEWLKIDEADDDSTLQSLLKVSKLLIKQFTGVKKEDVEDNEEALELYKLIQKIIITDLHENRNGSLKPNFTLTSLCIQLKAYKPQGGIL